MTDPQLRDSTPHLDRGAVPDDATPTGDSPLNDPTAIYPEQPWRRLAPGMLVVEPLREIIRFIPMLLVLLFVGRAGESGPPWGLIGTATVVALGISRWLTTRYRITPTVVEVRRGLIQRKHLTVPRDRVRTVDVSAHPLQRVLRLVKVQIGTGTSHQSAQELALDGLPAAAAGPLRAELLHRGQPGRARPIPVANGSADQVMLQPVEQQPVEQQPVEQQRAHHTGLQPDPEETELARLEARWVLYAPATLSGVITAAFLIGLGWRLLNEASLNPAQFAIVQNALGHLRSTPLWVDILQGVVLVVLVVTLLSLAGYLLSFWGYRLVRHSRGTLQITRGLLTTRATSIEERRLHGVERSEPLLLRAVGGARLQAIATGLRERGSDRVAALLVPPAPLQTVQRVEAAVLGSRAARDWPLRQHGPAARRRRYTRALGAALVVVVVIGLIAWRFHAPWLAVGSLLPLPVAALLAADRYRNLGHTVVDNSLISRAGSLLRRRSVLAVPGVIGVTIRQSVFQRRSGLLTVTATTAAGSQHYAVTDVPEAAGLELLAALLPNAAAVLSPSSPGWVVIPDGPSAQVGDALPHSDETLPGLWSGGTKG